jgi:nickel-type superoxide dismutase maturation protease
MVRKRHHPTHFRSGVRQWRLRRVVVTGTSMQPTLEPGDRLVIGPAWRLRPGQLVAVPDPRHTERLLVKRIHALSDGGADLRGDNPAGSTDSRHFGPVPVGVIRGRVWYRYAPPARAGWRPGRAG